MSDALAKPSETMSIMQIIGSAVDRLGGEGAKDAASAIETLVRLKREEDDRQARKAFFVAMNDFHRQCPPIPKDHSTKDTGRGGSQWAIKYAPLETIERIVRPLLVPLGFSWRWNTEAAGDTQMRVTCFVSHIEGHTESSSITVDSDAGGSMNKTQRSGATRTYGERYSFEQVLGLVTTADTDGVDPGTLAPIEEDQVATIEHLITSSGSNRAKFLEWLGVSSVASIKQGDYKKSTEMLKRKGGT